MLFNLLLKMTEELNGTNRRFLPPLVNVGSDTWRSGGQTSKYLASYLPTQILHDFLDVLAVQLTTWPGSLKGENSLYSDFLEVF